MIVVNSLSPPRAHLLAPPGSWQMDRFDSTERSLNRHSALIVKGVSLTRMATAASWLVRIIKVSCKRGTLAKPHLQEHQPPKSSVMQAKLQMLRFPLIALVISNIMALHLSSLAQQRTQTTTSMLRPTSGRPNVSLSLYKQVDARPKSQLPRPAPPRRWHRFSLRYKLLRTPHLQLLKRSLKPSLRLIANHGHKQ